MAMTRSFVYPLHRFWLTDQQCTDSGKDKEDKEDDKGKLIAPGVIIEGTGGGPLIHLD